MYGGVSAKMNPELDHNDPRALAMQNVVFTLENPVGLAWRWTRGVQVGRPVRVAKGVGWWRGSDGFMVATGAEQVAGFVKQECARIRQGPGFVHRV